MSGHATGNYKDRHVNQQYNSNSSLHYFIESLRDILDLDSVAVGDLFVTDDQGIVEYVRSNNYLSAEELHPGKMANQDQGYGQAIAQCLTSLSVAMVINEDTYDHHLRSILSIVIPVLHKDQLIACIGFLLDKNDLRVNVDMIQDIIKTAAQASLRMVEARQTLDEVQLLHEFYRNLDNSAAVILLDRDLKIVQTNYETDIFFGVGKGQLNGTLLNSLVSSPLNLSVIEQKSSYVEYKTRGRRIKSKTIFTPLLNTMGFHLGWRLTISPSSANRQISTASPTLFQFEDIVGNNFQFSRLIKLARSVSASPSNVLITGESGTGKELFAQAIHQASAYSSGPFVAINCAAIPKELIETELFGYVPGAFTGAKKDGNKGKFVQAHGGTLFLDEIGDMPLELQSKLLRVLQERMVTPVGGTNSIPIDIRVISATNQDLEKMIREKTFRSDLYYRLNVINLTIPPLRERKDDIPVLIDYFLDKYAFHIDKGKTRFTKSALQALQHYDWPGNVRELENVVELAVNLPEQEVDRHHLPEHITNYDNSHNYENSEFLTLEEMERMQIIKALRTFQGNITHAAEALNIGRTTLYRKIKKYNLVRLIDIGEGGGKNHEN